MKYKVEFTKRAIRDLKSLAVHTQKLILKQTIELETEPFPFKKMIKRIQGIKFPCYRFRVDSGSDSFRIFFGIEDTIVFIVRIVSQKATDKIIKNLINIDFPPDISN